jgi:hypothetical protein
MELVNEAVSITEVISPSSSAKQPSLSHSLPYNILPDLIQFSFLWITQQ